MKDGVMIINTSRGALIDSAAAINALKQGKIGALGMDVYENERDLFLKINQMMLFKMTCSVAFPLAITYCLPGTKHS